jgi:hypothetical protein
VDGLDFTEAMNVAAVLNMIERAMNPKWEE